ncbi:MAG TPA: aspartate aminotransferase family protein [Bacteroidales bacterium]|nr:aspartate aminotransferase family protein [Bacteroidales bacterium]
MISQNLTQEGDVNLTDRRKAWYDALSFEVRMALEDDASCFIHQSLSTPCLEVVSDCMGPYIVTSEGKKILDFHGNNVHHVGYKNPKILEALHQQVETLPFSPRRYTNQPAINLAKKLTKIAPDELTRVLFAPSGSLANSMAIKLARIYTGRHKIVSMWGSFHGAGLDTISVGGEAVFRKDIGPLMPGVVHVPPPISYRGLWNDDPQQDRYVEYIRYVFEHEGDVGALIAETIRDTDVQIPTKNFWQKVRALCDEYGVVLILDEIPIALGKTGKMFTFEHYGIVPDIVTLGKGLGGGVFPMAALLAKEKLNIAEKQSVGHFTHEKTPVGCAVALAVVNYIEENQILEHVCKLERRMYKRCMDFKAHYPIVGDFRGLGLLWGLELVTDRHTKKRACAEAEKILYHCLANGLNFKISQGNVITLSPPLIITEAQLNQAFDILEEALILVDKS